MATQEELQAQLQARHDKDTIARAIAALDARGCKYRVLESDGSEHTNIVKPEAQARVRVHDFKRDYNYIERIKAMKPGDVAVFMIEPKHIGDMSAIHNLRSSISHSCKVKWGKGNFKVEIAKDRTHIDVKVSALIET